jgi:hypothetical protein
LSPPPKYFTAARRRGFPQLAIVGRFSGKLKKKKQPPALRRAIAKWRERKRKAHPD